MIDGQALVNSLLQAIEAGVEQSLEEIKNEAQRRAPVRKLFKGGGRRKISGAIGVHNQIGSGRAYFMASRVGRTREGDYIRGRPNSTAPVTQRLTALNGGRLGGEEFRSVERQPGYNVAFRLTNARARVVGREILGRAKSDVARGRGLHVLPGGKSGVEYGGTLRDSIETVGPFRTSEGVTGYVKASAVEHGFNYAYAQEFGTAHNAPQPYLRPALRNMLKKITLTQRDAIRSRLERSPHQARFVTTGLELLIQPQGSFKTAGSGSALLRFSNRIDRALR